MCTGVQCGRPGIGHANPPASAPRTRDGCRTVPQRSEMDQVRAAVRAFAESEHAGSTPRKKGISPTSWRNRPRHPADSHRLTTRRRGHPHHPALKGQPHTSPGHRPGELQANPSRRACRPPNEHRCWRRRFHHAGPHRPLPRHPTGNRAPASCRGHPSSPHSPGSRLRSRRFPARLRSLTRQWSLGSPSGPTGGSRTGAVPCPPGRRGSRPAVRRSC